MFAANRREQPRRRLLVVAAGLLALGSLVLPARAHADGGAAIGTYYNREIDAADAPVSAWRSYTGVTPNYVASFTASNWGAKDVLSGVITQGNRWAAGWFQSHPDTTLIYAINMPPNTGPVPEDWATTYAQLARYFLDARGGVLAKTSIRLGWEMNGDWFPWSVNATNAAQYRENWNTIAATMLAIDPELTFIWNPVQDGKLADTTALAYPGDQYVSTYALDTYDETYDSVNGFPVPRFATAAEANARRLWSTNQILFGDQSCGFEANQGAPRSCWATHTTAACTSDQTNMPVDCWRQEAAAHGKGFAFAEWGISVPPTNAYGGGDDPYFVDGIVAYSRGHALTYDMQFVGNDGVRETNIDTGLAPNALAHLVGDLVPPVVRTVSDVYQIHDDHQVWRYNGAGVSPAWTRIAESGKGIVALAVTATEVFAKTLKGRVLQLRGSDSWTTLDGTGDVAQIAANAHGLFALRSDGTIVQWAGGTSWTTLAAAHADAQAIVTSGGLLFEHRSDGTTYRYDNDAGEIEPPGPTWTQVEADRSVVETAASAYFLLERTSDGHVSKFLGDPYNNLPWRWTELDTNAATTQVVADGTTVYQLHDDGSVWGLLEGGSWQRLSDAGRATQLVASHGALYALDGTNGIWQYGGSGETWTQIDTTTVAESLYAAVQ